jgi:Raf kinase inhibitor-like YbhB/YbcL family protein
MSLRLTSSAFTSQGEIPRRCSCEVTGAEVSPALAWSGAPAGAKSLALIVDDPDAPDPRAPQTTWVHWVLYNLPPRASGLPEGAGGGGAAAAHALPPGTRQGANDWHRSGYGAPCPPIGRHRYFFKLYALDTVLPDLGTPDKRALEQAMKGHVLAHAELVGTYQKQGA